MYSSSTEVEVDEAGKAAARRVGIDDARMGRCEGDVNAMGCVDECVVDGNASKVRGSKHQQPERQQGEQGI